jgi:hypothetical protein
MSRRAPAVCQHKAARAVQGTCVSVQRCGECLAQSLLHDQGQGTISAIGTMDTIPVKAALKAWPEGCSMAGGIQSDRRGAALIKVVGESAHLMAYSTPSKWPRANCTTPWVLRRRFVGECISNRPAKSSLLSCSVSSARSSTSPSQSAAESRLEAWEWERALRAARKLPAWGTGMRPGVGSGGQPGEGPGRSCGLAAPSWVFGW